MYSMHMRCATGLLEEFCARYAEAVAADAEARDFAVAVYEGFAQLRHTANAQRVVGEAEACESSFWADFSPLSSCRSPQTALKFFYRSERMTRY